MVAQNNRTLKYLPPEKMHFCAGFSYCYNVTSSLPFLEAAEVSFARSIVLENLQAGRKKKAIIRKNAVKA